MICAICTGPMREDLTFQRDMESMNDPRRQFRCLMCSRSVTFGMPEIKLRHGDHHAAGGQRASLRRSTSDGSRKWRRITAAQKLAHDGAMAGIGR